MKIEDRKMKATFVGLQESARTRGGRSVYKHAAVNVCIYLCVCVHCAIVVGGGWGWETAVIKVLDCWWRFDGGKGWGAWTDGDDDGDDDGPVSAVPRPVGGGTVSMWAGNHQTRGCSSPSHKATRIYCWDMVSLVGIICFVAAVVPSLSRPSPLSGSQWGL